MSEMKKTTIRFEEERLKKIKMHQLQYGYKSLQEFIDKAIQSQMLIDTGNLLVKLVQK